MSDDESKSYMLLFIFIEDISQPLQHINVLLMKHFKKGYIFNQLAYYIVLCCWKF